MEVREKTGFSEQIYGGNATICFAVYGVQTKTLFSNRDGLLRTGEAEYVITNQPRYVFMACDPNGGGAASDMAIVLLLEDNMYVVVGIETHCARGMVRFRRYCRRM